MLQCRGTSKQNQPCAIKWDLNQKGFCKYHADAPPCRGIKPDGSRCKISWGLNPVTQLCIAHEKQASTAEASTDNNGMARPSVASVAPAAPEQDCSSNKTGSSSATEATPRSGTESNCDGQDDLSAAATDHGLLPPLWTVRYIPSTGAIVVRMYSEYSWHCHHEPIVFWVHQWSHRRSCVVRCMLALGRVIPGIKDVVSTEGDAALTCVEKTKDLMKVLKALNITHGGLYTSEGSFDSDDQRDLEYLLRQQKEDYSKYSQGRVSKLRLVRGANVWVSKGELEKYGIDRMVRSEEPTPSAMLLFECKTGKLPRVKRHHRAMIHWKLLKVQSAAGQSAIESGVACIDEPIPLMRVDRSELEQYAVHIEIKSSGDSGLGSGSVRLEGLPFTIRGSETEGNEADEGVRHVAMDTGLVVHVRLLELTEPRLGGASHHAYSV